MEGKAENAGRKRKRDSEGPESEKRDCDSIHQSEHEIDSNEASENSSSLIPGNGLGYGGIESLGVFSDGGKSRYANDDFMGTRAHEDGGGDHEDDEMIEVDYGGETSYEPWDGEGEGGYGERGAPGTVVDEGEGDTVEVEYDPAPSGDDPLLEDPDTQLEEPEDSGQERPDYGQILSEDSEKEREGKESSKIEEGHADNHAACDAGDDATSQRNPSRSETHFPPPSKRQKRSTFSSKAEKMMAKMGYKRGAGLGKEGKGRVNPVQESSQISRQGLGFASANMEIKRELAAEKETEMEGVVEVKVKLAVEWAPEDTSPVPSEFTDYLQTGSDVLFESEDSTEWRDSADRQRHHQLTTNANIRGYFCKLCDKFLSLDEQRLRIERSEHEKTELHQERIRVMCGDYASIVLQRKIFAAKSRFDSIDDRSFKEARSRSNPFELIKKEGFQNRAALKMAEVDAMTNRLFTQNPLVHSQSRERRKRTLTYFADICAGPGGFSEFMLAKLKWRAKGFGFTLRGNNDFKLYKFTPTATTQAFRAFYGVDDSGDITKTPNMRDFQIKVLEGTKGRGVHIVMADGGFSVRGGRENQQELLSQQLVLCQFVTALMILQKGGTFICKLFDTFLPFTVHCMFLLKKCFKKFALLKPNQSRPANSERYILCTGLKEANPEKLIEYMLRVNDIMNGFRAKNETSRVIRLVPESEIDDDFKSYVRAWNNANARRQIMSLNKIMRYILDKGIPSDNQELIRRECIEFWGLKSGGGEAEGSGSCARDVYVPLDKSDGIKLFQHLHNNRTKNHHNQNPWRMGSNLVSELRRRLEDESFKFRLEIPFASRGHGFEELMKRAREYLKKPKEWFCYRLPPNGIRYYMFSTPSGIVLERDGKFTHIDIRRRHESVPPDTILDVVMCATDLYVIDAHCLGGDTDVHKRDFLTRIELLSLFLDSTRYGGEEVSLRHEGPVHVYTLIDDSSFFESKEPKDLYFVRNRPKPTPSIEFHMTAREDEGAGFISSSAMFPLPELLKKLRNFLYHVHIAAKKGYHGKR